MQPDEDITPDSAIRKGRTVNISEHVWEIVRERAFVNRTSIKQEVETLILESATATKVA